VGVVIFVEKIMSEDWRETLREKETKFSMRGNIGRTGSTRDMCCPWMSVAQRRKEFLQVVEGKDM